MRKALITSIMLLWGAMSLYAQTYLYKQTYVVNQQTGVKKKGNMTNHYFTFTSNACYESDKNGNLAQYTILLNTTPATVTVFEGVENGVYIYKEPDQDFGFGHILRGSLYYYVAPDKSRINRISKMNVGDGRTGDVRVYERIEEPENQSAPVQLY